jgi:hypothetical protein
MFPKTRDDEPMGTQDSLFSALQFQKLPQLRGLGSCRRPIQGRARSEKGTLQV